MQLELTGNFDYIFFVALIYSERIKVANFDERKNFHTASLVFKCLKGHVADGEYISKSISRYESTTVVSGNTITSVFIISCYNLRHRHDLILPRPNKEHHR